MPTTTDQPEPTPTPTAVSIDLALRALLATDVTYGPGFANHGPMAVEALEHLDRPGADITRFLDGYLPRLRAKQPDAVAPDDWRAAVAEAATRLAPAAAAMAGHGLLRLAHAVRAVERHDTPVRRTDVAEAVAYWGRGTGLPTPRPAGDRSVAEVLAAVPRLRPTDTGGMLTRTLALAASDPGVEKTLASLAPPVDHLGFLDQLALASADRYLANGDDRAFVFIHGVTVPTMASVLLPHLDPAGRHELSAAVAAFVGYAVAGFDTRPETAGLDAVPADLTPPPPGTDGDVALAAGAAASLDDHTIKFTDACLTLSDRTGLQLPRLAAAVRVAATT